MSKSVIPAPGFALARPDGSSGSLRDVVLAGPGAVTTVLVLGLCLFCGQGYAGVIARLWPLLRVFNPVVVLCAPVCAVALSQARARLPVAVLRELFTQTAVAADDQLSVTGSRVFGLVVTATDGTVFDLPATDALRARFATPSGGRFPQARVVTLVACGTRRVLAARLDSCQVSEQVGPVGRFI